MYKFEIGSKSVVKVTDRDTNETIFESDNFPTENIKISGGTYKGVKWTPKVVYSVYCNDDLDTLPIAILEDMKKYIDEVIDSKSKEDKLIC